MGKGFHANIYPELNKTTTKKPPKPSCLNDPLTCSNLLWHRCLVLLLTQAKTAWGLQLICTIPDPEKQEDRPQNRDNNQQLNLLALFKPVILR